MLFSQWMEYTWLSQKHQYVCFTVYHHRIKAETQEIGVHEASLCVLLVLEIVCFNTKIILALMLSAWCAFRVIVCVLSACHLSSHWVVCVYFQCTLLLSTRWTQNQHTVNTRNPEHTLAPISTLRQWCEWNSTQHQTWRSTVSGDFMACQLTTLIRYADKVC